MWTSSRSRSDGQVLRTLSLECNNVIAFVDGVVRSSAKLLSRHSSVELFDSIVEEETFNCFLLHGCVFDAELNFMNEKKSVRRHGQLGGLVFYDNTSMLRAYWSCSRSGPNDAFLAVDEVPVTFSPALHAIEVPMRIDARHYVLVSLVPSVSEETTLPMLTAIPDHGRYGIPVILAPTTLKRSRMSRLTNMLSWDVSAPGRTGVFHRLRHHRFPLGNTFSHL